MSFSVGFVMCRLVDKSLLCNYVGLNDLDMNITLNLSFYEFFFLLIIRGKCGGGMRSKCS